MIGEIFEIAFGVLVLAICGAVASVLLGRHYARWMSATLEREARMRGKNS